MGAIDYHRLLFDRLSAAGDPGPAERAMVYAACREELRRRLQDGAVLAAELAALEKAIRRQEAQCVYEDGLAPPPGA